MSPTMQSRSIRVGAMNAAFDAAGERADGWGLPELTGSQERAVVAGTLIRDRALTVVERDLVRPGSQRRVRAPGHADMWAGDWWRELVLPEAQGRTTAAWWIRRSPRTVAEWALLLDSSTGEVA